MPEQHSHFRDFYRTVFLAEHRNPKNVALHVLGTVLSGVFLVTVILLGVPWLALAYPVVHAAPGLLGHRLFERNSAVGDVRITRKDYSPLWFIAGNHLMTTELLLKGFYWRTST
jgi:hypothetical protein